MSTVKTFLVIIVVIIINLPAHAQEELLSRPYKPAFSEAQVKAFLDDIEKQTGIPISYSSSAVNSAAAAHITGKENTIGEVLEAVLAGQQISIVARRNKILIVPDEKNKKPGKQRLVTINGYVKETGSMEVLIGAVVLIPELKTGTVTNNYGYYSLSVPEGDYTIFTSYIGYKADTFNISLEENNRRDILLSLQNTLTEVTITSTTREKSKNHVHLNYEDIIERPKLLGENDLMRALQNYAGVSTAMEGSNKVLVRGGDPGQNLNLLDGVPLYYIDHFFGLTSIFNGEAIKSVDFYKGAFPARYGGRLSSVIDISSKDGDMEQWGGQFTMGLVKGSVNIEGPIIKNKSSIMISCRRTWLDALWRFSGNEDARNTKVDFYDINVKANYILDENNRLYISVYNGRDQIGVRLDGDELGGRWGNAVGSAKWNRIVSPKVFLNTMLTYSRFKFFLQEKTENFYGDSLGKGTDYKGTSTIDDIAFNSQVTLYPNTSHKIDAGIHYSYAYFVPVALQTFLPQIGVGINSITDRFYSNELTLFAEDEIKLSNRWTISPGVHFANWFSRRFNYSSLQPRIHTSYKLGGSHVLYASFAEMAQFLHPISNTTIGLPIDFWLPSTSHIRPEESYTTSLGYNGGAGKNFNYTIELYYKDIRNVTTYGMGKNLFDNTRNWEDNIIQGDGWSYGMESSLNAKAGDFAFRLAYTLSSTWRRFATLNGGKPFPYRYDRRHNLKAAVIYKPSRKFEASANWTYMTGEAITLPDQIYPDLDQNLLVRRGNYYSSDYTFNYAAWNDYRLPPIHRLDIAMNFNKVIGRRLERTWSLGVYNAYMRRNVMFVTLVNDIDGFRLNGLSILQFIPYVSYQLRF